MEKMKTALLATTLAVGVALAAGSAYAADLRHVGVVQSPAPAATQGLYVSVFGGAALENSVNGLYSGSSNFEVPTNAGYVIGGAVGTHITSNVRGELELSYVSHGVKDTMTWDGTSYSATGNFATLYALGNLWYDIDTGSAFTPYLGGGAGVAVLMPNFDADGDPFNTNAFAPAVQLGGGVSYALTDSIKLDVGYRAKFVFNGTYLGEDSGVSGTSYVDQTIQAGLTFGF